MCGIFGIEGAPDAANLTYLGLYAEQHRGQESAGIVSWDGEQLHAERGMGKVAEIFDANKLAGLPGDRAIGHTRYSTAGSSVIANAQPIVVMTSMGPLGIVHNGNLVSAMATRHELEAAGSIFQTTSDSEVFLHLMATRPHEEIVESLLRVLGDVRGAYSLLLITQQGLIAARDPYGFRPLILGDLDGQPCFASESCAFDLLEARSLRELDRGEVVVARGDRIESYRLPPVSRSARCIFEHVYFARPDSEVFSDSVAQSRLKMGARLAQEAPVEADLVVPVPDSGLYGALGFSRASGTPLELGLIRNHYVGRTFIEPQQSIRHFGVKVKLNPVRELIAGKRIVLVDDSIVRGTTSRKIVSMVREAGASEVHIRITSPPTAFSCIYGIDTPTRGELIASDHSLEEIRRFIRADSLGYLSLEGLLGCVSGSPDTYCTACWTGEYPVPDEGHGETQAELFPLRLEAG